MPTTLAKPVRKVLLACEPGHLGRVMEESISPLRWAKAMAALGLKIEFFAATQPLRLLDAARSDADVIVYVPNFLSPVDLLGDVLKKANTLPSRPSILLLDLHDQSSSPHLALLDRVDRYAKKVVLRNRHDYLNDYAGKFVFTDFLQKQLEYDLDGWQFGCRLEDTTSLNKLVLSWNYATAPLYRKILLLSRLASRPWRLRRIEVNGRFDVTTDTDQKSWYARYRRFAREQLNPPGHPWTTNGPGRLSKLAYLLEMGNSKFAFSPFGYGELCLRDLEAVCMGALLLKPDVSHLESVPDIYIPNQTYIPLKWDLSDLRQQIEHHLAHPEKAIDIARAGRVVVKSYLDKRLWKEDVLRVFDGLGRVTAKPG